MKRYLLLAMLVGLWSTWASALEPVGWRTDSTGSYPHATPPKTWSTEKNVIWRTKMPSWSNASPTIVGEKIFVCSEQAVLLCVNRADGKILWQKDNLYQDVVLSPALKQQLEVEQKQADEVLKQIKGVLRWPQFANPPRRHRLLRASRSTGGEAACRPDRTGQASAALEGPDDRRRLLVRLADLP